MENFLTIDDFKGIILLQDDRLGNEKFTKMISQFQFTILNEMLGTNLYLALEAGLLAAVDVKWTELRDGKTISVTISDRAYTIKFTGLKGMLKGFIYFYTQREASKNAVNIGNVTEEAENAIQIDFSDELVAQYNNSIALYGYDWNIDFCDYQKPITLNSFHRKHNQSSLLSSKIANTCYNFIKYQNDAVADTYPDWIFTYKFDINQFNI